MIFYDGDSIPGKLWRQAHQVCPGADAGAVISGHEGVCGKVKEKIVPPPGFLDAIK